LGLLWVDRPVPIGIHAGDEGGWIEPTATATATATATKSTATPSAATAAPSTAPTPSIAASITATHAHLGWSTGSKGEAWWLSRGSLGVKNVPKHGGGRGCEKGTMSEIHCHFPGLEPRTEF
jgi:hypothetical protein